MPESDADRMKREAAAEAKRERERALREVAEETKNNRPPPESK